MLTPCLLAVLQLGVQTPQNVRVWDILLKNSKKEKEKVNNTFSLSHQRVVMSGDEVQRLR